MISTNLDICAWKFYERVTISEFVTLAMKKWTVINFNEIEIKTNRKLIFEGQFGAGAEIGAAILIDNRVYFDSLLLIGKQVF